MTRAVNSSATSNPPLLTSMALEALQWQILDKWQRNQDKTRAPHSGPFASFFRGQGMEPHDSRPYQAGDDIRHLDWRAIARSGKATTKVFLDERGRSLFLVIDRHPGMFFGTRVELKAASAARAAAILAFTALAARDRVAGAIIDNGIHYFPSANTLAGVLPLLYAAAAPAPTTHARRATSQLPSLLPALAQRSSPGTDLCLISDFHDLSDQDAPALQALSHDYAVHAIRIRDSGEEALKDIGSLRVYSPRSDKYLTIDTHDNTLRERYLDAMTAHSKAVTKLFAQCGIALTTIDNSLDTLTQMETFHARN